MANIPRGSKNPYLLLAIWRARRASRISAKKRGIKEMDPSAEENDSSSDETQPNLADLRKSMGGIIKAIVKTIEMRDPYTAGHQHRVAHLSRAIAHELKLKRDQIEGIRTAATIHDLGKISVPAEILSKPGKLTDCERGIIEAHPQAGYDIVSSIDITLPIASILLQHHERIDGSGYPNGVLGEEIFIEAKIIGVADVIEAMASHRPYRAATGIDEALDEIAQGRGVLYEQEVVDVCLLLFNDKGFSFDSVGTDHVEGVE